MLLKDAQIKINKIAGKKFGELFNKSQIENIIRNKGKTGQLLEIALGMKLSNTNRDFEDGELKTNKCNSSGKPLETVFIMQIAGVIDEMIQQKPKPFEETLLYQKISNILYVPVCKVGKADDWFFLPSIHIDLGLDEFSSLTKIWKEDFYSICLQLKKHIETSKDGFIHTSSGKHIQIRSKDSKPYHPIWSEIYGREVSNKNHAFYFKKEFVYSIRKMHNK